MGFSSLLGVQKRARFKYIVCTSCKGLDWHLFNLLWMLNWIWSTNSAKNAVIQLLHRRKLDYKMSSGAYRVVH